MKLIQTLVIILNVLFVQLQQQPFLNFGMIQRPPHFMAKNMTVNNNQSFQGSWVDAIDWLSIRLRFSYKIIPSKEAWSETTVRLQRGDFDVIGPPMIMTISRGRLFDYVGVFEEENSALVTPALTEESSILSTLKPFKPLVWLMVLISLVSVSIYFSTSSMLNIYHSDMNERSLSIGDYVLYAIAILTNQGPVFWHPSQQSRLSFRLTAGVWGLLAFVMVNVYSSTLTAHITNRKMSTPPNGSIQVMEQGILSYLVIDEGLGRDIILSATSGPLKKMGDIFRRHPEYFIPNTETGFLKVASGCCAYSELVTFLKYRIGKDFQETGKCRVHIGKPIRGYGFSGLILKKGSIYRNSLNLGTLEMYQTGLVEQWREKYFLSGMSPCESPKKKKFKILRRLNLQDLASAFFILGIGVLLSFLAFSFEQFRRC